MDENPRINEFCHTLIADAIGWTQGDLNQQQKQALIKCMRLLAEPEVSSETFMTIRQLLDDNDFCTTPKVDGL